MWPLDPCSAIDTWEPTPRIHRLLVYLTTGVIAPSTFNVHGPDGRLALLKV